MSLRSRRTAIRYVVSGSTICVPNTWFSVDVARGEPSADRSPEDAAVVFYAVITPFDGVLWGLAKDSVALDLCYLALPARAAACPPGNLLADGK